MSMPTNAGDDARQNATMDRNYTSVPGVYDEMLATDGTLRDHWRPFVEGLAHANSATYAERSAKLNRFVRETGVAYNLFADPADDEQPWYVDPIPLIVDAQEWAWLERALNQRARLFNAILNDIYGPQTLLKSGAIPPALIFSDPSFLRACHGLIPQESYLRFYAADLARAPDGTWRVLDNHTETPAGIGFAIANRIIMTHCEGDLFRHCNAHRLSTFFEVLQEDLIRYTGQDNPHIALLTPGPLHDDYFGHAYLARYLGYTLVEGEDLVVADGRVYLKTLEGLQHLDLIVRCVEGAYCDPLELNPSGFLAPVGLVDANRHNTALVVNGLGSAIVQNRALGSYLPDLCKTILGEDLMLFDEPGYWLGDPKAREKVLGDLSSLVIRGAHEGTGRPGQASEGIIGAGLPAAERERLVQDIALHGKTMVAEEIVGIATTPSLTENGFEPAHCAVRFFAAHIAGEYKVMPGGLAMTVSSDAATALSAPKGEARDVWVISPSKVSHHISRLRPSLENIEFQRTGLGLPSRVADNLFWLGRYAERTEWTMRLVRSTLARLEEDSGPEEDTETLVKALMVWLTKDPGAPMALGQTGPADPIISRVRTLIYGPQRSYGLQSSLDNLHRVAGLTRDRLSLEAWRTLNSFFSARTWQQELALPVANEAVDRLNDGITTLAAFSGMAMENMTRNFGWRFLDMGRRIERAINLAELLQALFVHSLEEETERDRLTFMLELADSIMTYRSRYRLAPILPAALDLLLLDETNPRALAFQLAAIMEHVGTLATGAHTTHTARRTQSSRIVLDILTQIRLADPVALSKTGPLKDRKKLADVLRHQVEKLEELSDELTRSYFKHNRERPHMVTIR